MATDNHKPRDYEDGDLDIRLDIRKPNTGNGKALKWLAIVVVTIGVISVLTGMVILFLRSADSDATATKLVGSWRGQFIAGGQQIDAVYVFERNGNFRQETVDQNGQLDLATGHWRVFLGKVEIDWDNGGFEHATVVWRNDQTMEWLIFDHNDLPQIGTVTIMNRHQPLLRRK